MWQMIYQEETEYTINNNRVSHKMERNLSTQPDDNIVKKAW